MTQNVTIFHHAVSSHLNVRMLCENTILTYSGSFRRVALEINHTQMALDPEYIYVKVCCMYGSFFGYLGHYYIQDTKERS